MRLQVSAKADYALRALVVLASQPPGTSAKSAEIARQEGLPSKFLEDILVELRRKGLATSTRGPMGGFRIGRPADQITVADVLEAVDGPLVDVHGYSPSTVVNGESPLALQQLWAAAETGVRDLLVAVTIEDLRSSDIDVSATDRPAVELGR